MQPTTTNFQTNRYDAYQNQMPLIHIWLEKQDGVDQDGIIDVPNFTSPQAFGAHAIGQGRYCAANKNIRSLRWHEPSAGERLISANGTRGYFYEISRRDGGKEQHAHFMRRTE